MTLVIELLLGYISSQTPTFNAPAVVEATLAAVRKGKEITLFLDLGFNDGVSPLIHISAKAVC